MPRGRPRRAPSRRKSAWAEIERLELADDAGGVARGDGAGGDRAGDHGAGADHGVVADRGSLEDLHAHADEDVVADLDRGHLRGAAVAAARVEVVEVGVEDLDVGAEEAVLADPDARALALQHQVVVELGAVTDLDRRLRGADLNVTVAGVEEGRGAPAELDPLAEGDGAVADPED